MITVNPPFETVVMENSKWLLRFIKQKVRNPSIAEDMLQESLLSAFRYYDTYVENGKIKAWLMRITSNVLNNYYGNKSEMTNTEMSLSMDDEDNGFTETLFDDTDSTFEIIVRDDTVDQIMGVIDNLNDRDREIMYHRYIYDMSLEDVSEKLGIPLGTVKSRTHNAITKIQKQMGVITPQMKGVHIMNCKETYKYLFMYAKGIISEENKKMVDQHIADCQECYDIVYAMKLLIPHITYAPDDVLTHFNINFDIGNTGICYSNMKNALDYRYMVDEKVRAEYDDYIENVLNKYITEHDGELPEGTTGITGHGGGTETLAIFNNDGSEMKFTETPTEGVPGHFRTKITHMSKIFTPAFHYTVYDNNKNNITPSPDAPNLFTVSNRNNFGVYAKTGLYQAIPAKAKNIRVKRGNGLIDCGTYKFVYVDRFAAQDETIVYEATFNM